MHAARTEREGEQAAPRKLRPGHCIFLINQISGHGHLDMYARLYSKSLLEAGYDVVLVSQFESDARSWLAEQAPALARHFTFFSRAELEDRSFVRAPGHAQPALSRGPLARALRLAKRTHRRLGRLWRRFRADGVLETIRDQRNPRRHHPLPFGVPFGSVVDDMKEITHRTGLKPAFVLFLYLDMMSEEAESCRDLEEYGVPFAGIRFHPNGSNANGRFRPERYFLLANARGAIFLNPHSIPDYSRRLPHCHFAPFPDITDTRTPPAPSPLVQAMTARAAGRRIVLQLGTLAPHKGIFELIALIRRADPKQFLFAIVGEVMWDNYGDRAEELRAFLEHPPENCFVALGYIEDERELNALIRAADILYAVYRDGFFNSSNTITKAAVFEKPILVNGKNLMGERVRAYRLGETVRSGDIEDTLFWLEEAAARPRERFGFAAFRRDHSIEAMNACLAAAMMRWLDADGGGAHRTRTARVANAPAVALADA